MKERATAMLRVCRIMDALLEDDRAAVALEVWREYGAQEDARLAFSTAVRSSRYRARQRDEVGVTERDVGVTENVSRNVTERDSVTNLPIEVDSEVALKTSETPATKRQIQRLEAKEVLRFLNEKTGRMFREVEGNLSLIMARMASGATVQDCKGVIARKVREWKDDEKMISYLRPETLFNRTKFESYLGQREVSLS